MNSPDVAAALYAGAPDAAGQLYDAHAEALFQYSWLTLRSRQHAQAAVCDALVQAGVRVAELGDPATLRAWLFALVRAECQHHPLPSPGDADEPIARPQQRDAALRIMAWNSVMSLSLPERQALDLATRHGMTTPEIGLILDLPVPGATELLATGRQHLERALGAEILVSRDSLECPGRTEALHGWSGTVTPALRERLLEHAGACPVCRPRLPRKVSAGRIFGLLPAPALDGGTRNSVITRVSDLVQGQADAADTAAEPAAVMEIATPELAVLPAGELYASAAPPAAPGPPAGPANLDDERRRRRRPGTRLFAGAAAAVAAVAVAAGLTFGSLSGHARLSGPASQLAPGTGTPAQAGLGSPVPQPDAPSASPGHGRRAHQATATSPAVAAGGADAVTSGKQATSGAIRPIVMGRGARRTVIVALLPRPRAAGSGRSRGSATPPGPVSSPPTATSPASPPPSTSQPPSPSPSPSRSHPHRPSPSPSPSRSRSHSPSPSPSPSRHHHRPPPSSSPAPGPDPAPDPAPDPSAS